LQIFFSVDEHVLNVIEVDGTTVEPYPVDFIRINVGQRYTCLIFTETDGNFWIRSIMDNTVFFENATQNTARGILRVGNSGNSLPTSSAEPLNAPPAGIGGLYQCPPGFTSCTVDLPTSLQPIPPEDAPDSTVVIPLTIAFFPNNQGVVVAHWNNISFQTRTDTTILNLVRAGQPVPTTANFFEIGNSVVDLLINNLDTGEHPLHLHGHVFYVLAQGAPGAGDFNASVVLNTNNPVKRDTVSVNPQSWIYVRFVANNPGVWLFHCHINWHALQGLVTGFIEDANRILQKFPETQSLLKCPNDPGEAGDV